MAAAKKKEKKPISTGASSEHITNLKQSILETFNIYGWHAIAVSLPPDDTIFAQLACPINDVIVLLTSGITNLSLYKH